MSYQIALKKAGLPLVRSFMHSMEGVQMALPAITQKRNKITFKLKDYKDGKMISSKYIETIQQAFPAKGDVK